MALPNIQQSDVRFSVTFNLNAATKNLVVEDLVQDDYATMFQDVILAEFFVLVKVTSPSGQILHINSGWGTDDFSSPDIEDNTWATDPITLLLDQNGHAETGAYIIEYKVSIDNGVRAAFTVSKTVTMSYTPFNTVASLSMNYTTSVITSVDQTDYDVELSGTTYENQTNPALTRQHLLIKPPGAQCVVSSTPSANETITFGGGGTPATDVWTGLWSSSVATQVQYNLATWDGDVSVIVNDTVSGGGSLEVEWNSCACAIRQCIINLVERYKEAVASGSTLVINQLREKVIKVNSAWMNYVIAERCGESTTEFCDEIVSITRTENCDCSASSTSQRIVPIGTSLSGGGDSTVIAHGSAAPTGGAEGSYYFDVSVYKLYSKVASTWVDLGSFAGGTGPTGGDGPTGPVVTGPTGPVVTGPTGPVVTGPTGPLREIGYGASVPTGGVDGDYYFMIPGYILYKNITSIWTNLGSFMGGTGPTGGDGPTGPGYTGPTGPAITGPTGLVVTGPVGPTGPTGYVVSLSIRYGATSPTGGSAVPQALGQVYINTATREAWMAMGLSGTDWRPIYDTP